MAVGIAGIACHQMCVDYFHAVCHVFLILNVWIKFNGRLGLSVWLTFNLI